MGEQIKSSLLLTVSQHRILMQTGITCKKIPCYMRDSACRWLIVENPKIFRSYVKESSED